MDGPVDLTRVAGDRRVAAALASVDAAALVADLRALIAVPSVTGSDAESDAQHLLAGWYREAGLDVDRWPVELADTTADPSFPGSEAPRTQAWGLVATTPAGSGPGGPPALVLNSHVDVVPAGSRADWSVDPWQGAVRGGRVLGRGAADTKGGLVCQLAAVRALRAAGVGLPGRVALHSVVGEEDGGLGTWATLRRGHTGAAAVICEPTSLALVPAAAGALTFRLTVPGRSAHASVRTSGVDAVGKYLLVHDALRRLEAERNAVGHPLMERWDVAWPLSVGTVRAGDWASSVPDRVVAEGRIGVAIGEPEQSARAALTDALARVCAGDGWLAEHPVRLEWVGGRFASGATDPDAAVARLVAGAHAAATGSAPAVHGVPYGSDLRLFTAAGIPTVHYGPGELAQAHAPDESVAVEELVTATRTLVLVAAAAAGAGGSAA